MMIQLAATLISILLVSQVTSFVPCNIGHMRHSHCTTSLFGKIRFVGNAHAQLSTQPIIINNGVDDDKSLSKFLATPASDPVLLGTKANVGRAVRIDNNQSSSGELWEVAQGSIGWFGMSLVPIFVNKIKKNIARGSGHVVVYIIDAKTEVESGGGSRFGNTLASIMKNSMFEGMNSVAWNEQNNDTDAQIYALEGRLELTIEINVPRFLPIPPGFNAIGGKIIERTCRTRLKQNLIDISDSYSLWANS